MEIMLPSTFSIEERDPKLRTAKIDLIARAASIFGIEKIIIYKDPDLKANEEKNAKIMEKYLLYAETPPYLRKQLIPYDPDLKYANILSPLLIPSHRSSEQYREAYIKEQKEEKTILEAGLDTPLIGNMPEREEGERVTVKRIGDNHCEPVKEEEIPGFWTFQIKNYRETLKEVLERKNTLIIGTSRFGRGIRKRFKKLRESKINNATIVFGSAWRGIYEIMDRGGFDESYFDFILNTIPDQTTETVRTEEALYITLGILNLLKK